MYRPSEVVGCIRKVWYGYKYPIRVSVEKRKNVQDRKSFRNFIARVLKNCKNRKIEFIRSEVPINVKIDNLHVCD